MGAGSSEFDSFGGVGGRAGSDSSTLLVSGSGSGSEAKAEDAMAARQL